MKLQIGDHIKSEGLTDDQHSRAIQAFIDAGADVYEGTKYKGWISFTFFGWDKEGDTYHGNSKARFGGRLLTIEQVIGPQPTEEEEEAFKEIEKRQNAMPKQTRYLEEDGKDLIDRWADRYTPEEFRLIMWVMIEKYQTRLGKKDDIAKEVRKIADYANRWAEVEEGR